MRNCFKVPRLFIPREEFGLWAVADGELPRAGDYWERVATQVGGAPSALSLTWNTATEGGGESMDHVRNAMYTMLEEDKIEKLNRGGVFVERETPRGVRKGIVMCIDLEQFSFREGEAALIHASQEAPKKRIGHFLSLRRVSPLEFPHAVLLYKDKKLRAERRLSDLDLEILYDFDLMEGGGRIRGSFLPEYVCEELFSDLKGKGEPAFAVAEGEAELAAAKLFWEETKRNLQESELRRHPARFALVEFVNLYDQTVEFLPVYRLLRDADTEAFSEFLGCRIKCKRSGALFFPYDSSPRNIARADAAIKAFLQGNAGYVTLTEDRAQVEEVCKSGHGCAVAFAPFEKEDLFDELKRGALLPEGTFAFAAAEECRYSLEGREIGYD